VLASRNCVASGRAGEDGSEARAAGVDPRADALLTTVSIASDRCAHFCRLARFRSSNHRASSIRDSVSPRSCAIRFNLSRSSGETRTVISTLRLTDPRA
jgi:hypothetical protein